MNAFPTHSVPLQIGTIDQLSHYIAEIQSVWGKVPANRPLARAALVSLSHLLQELHHDQSFWRRLEQFSNSTTGESSASTICSILGGIIRDSFANQNEPYAVRTVSSQSFPITSTQAAIDFLIDKPEFTIRTNFESPRESCCFTSINQRHNHI